ncbi:MAG: oxidoreductase [Omnitrophica WOR_2 bacterium RIFCSPHIGHO2_01_FULL_52_10]|nr:MAG: oxidoreductase [Omnitrophica WOR_2 bacterium RIFCSPHIGHO2_01_FULL_52_10]
MNNSEKIAEAKYSEEQIRTCVAVLEDLVRNSVELAHLSTEQRIALITAAGQLSRPQRDEIRKRKRDSRRIKRQRVVNYERRLRASSGIRSAREAAVFTVPLQITDEGVRGRFKELELVSPRDCYVCKRAFIRVHFFYDAMCPSCAQFNYAKRFQTASLKGQVALITGSRLKIGYQATLMMLRAGARVIATTRFPVDSALRYSREEDFPQWQDRLHIYGLDLRHTPSIEIFCNYIEQKYDRLDILINNAAQTVRRPPGFYGHLVENEAKRIEDLPEGAQRLLRPFDMCKKELMSYTHINPATDLVPAVAWNGKMQGIGLSASAALSQIPYSYDHALPAEQVFPKGKLDADLQQVDLRETNTWRLRLGEVPTAELLELQLVNAIAPFVLCNRLSTMMKRDNTGQKHIVNVSAMEGKFLRYVKTDRHPHTNMAKAALNMLTHTSASDLVKSGIFMNSVDTGWVTDEDPFALSRRKQQVHDFQPPLDIVDGAARVCDPFFDGILTGKHWCGKFLKDYFPIDW